MNNHEHLDTSNRQKTESNGGSECPVEQMVFQSELGEQQRRRLLYREWGQLGPGTY